MTVVSGYRSTRRPASHFESARISPLALSENWKSQRWDKANVLLTANVQEITNTGENSEHVPSVTFVPAALGTSDFCKVQPSVIALLDGKVYPTLHIPVDPSEKLKTRNFLEIALAKNALKGNERAASSGHLDWDV
uniref:Uncharacterized protein n=1 Tax=Vespula pensylvanica TaxID=30213 RepID=A0A834UF77_VESPE|nr:hypothetical protein H0235_003694 [Vespula pensylvanica]